MTIRRVSTSAAGGQGNGASYEFTLSSDGTKLVFTSESTNFTGDGNMASDVFLKDLVTGAISRISTTSAGGEADDPSESGALSPDGTKIAFVSLASNLVGGDTNGFEDVFVKDIASGAVTRISTSVLGGEGNALSSRPVFSPDGNLIAFTSSSSNLVPGDTNNSIDLFVKNLTTGAITRISTDALGNQGNLGAQGAKVVFSPDGTKIAFSSFSSNLVAGDTNGQQDIFVKDLVTSAITRVSVGTNGEQGNFDSVNPVFSPDGSKLLFDSSSNGLVASDTNNANDLFLKDLNSGQLTRVSTGAGGTQSNGFSAYGAFSADGSMIAFESEASNLVAGDTNGVSDIFVKSLATGVVTRVSGGTGAAQSDGASFSPAFLPDGSVAFTSEASNFVAGDTNGVADIFVATLDQTADYAKVNTTVTGAQFAPAVAALSGGGYVIVWEDSSAGRIFAQRFSAAGAKVGNELQLDSTQGGSALWVSVAATASDGFVIAFQAGGFAQAEIFARRYDGANAPVGGLFAVNTTSPNEQFNPHITVLDGGNLLFTWDTQALDVFQEVRGRIFTSDGQALGQDFAVAPVSATDRHGLSAITSLPGGGFVVTWQRASNSGTNFEIVGQRFTSGGAPIGTQFQANTQTVNNQFGNDVARLSDGGFVVSWTDPVPGNGGGRIVARHYDASGNAVGGEIVIDSKASGAYGRTTVTATASGGYVVSWTENDGTAAQNNVLARQMAANDLPVGPAFEMSFNSPFGANYFSDGAVTLSNGNVVFAWDGPSTNTGQDIYARQYSFTTPSTTPTEGDDLLGDTAGNNTINALGGNDSITVTNGRDTVNGGAGNDVLVINYGSATIGVGTYNGPIVNPNGGFDGGIAANSPQISSQLVAFTGIERFIVTTGSAADDITVASGNDEVRTGAGNDRVNVGSGVDIADGGADVDAISADLSGLLTGATINLGNAVNTGAYGTYSNFEYFGTITGSNFDDVFVTTDVAQIDTINGGAGNDAITVGNGRDVVSGGSGTDTLTLDWGSATQGLAVNIAPTANPNGGFDGNYSEGPAQVASRLVAYSGIERFVFRLGAANDVLTIATPLDDADGGAGTDTLSGNFAGGPAVSIDLGTSTRFVNFEAFGTITGSSFGDSVVTRPGQFNETLNLGDGDDVATLFDGRDSVAGGAGFDTLIVNYSAATGGVSNDPALAINPNGGFDGAFAEGPGQIASRITLFTGIERFEITGGSGNDNLTTGSGDDRLDLAVGGNDTVSGGAGNDGFFFGAAFTAADTVDGGSGSNDQVGLQGNYAAGLTLGAGTLTNVEVVAVLPGFSYSLTTNDANVAVGQMLSFFGGNLGAGENFTVDGSAETNGNFRMYGGLGNDTFTGGALDDGFYFGPGKWGAGDSVVGGGGTNDQLALDGDYSVTIGANADVETLVLLPGPAGSPNTFAVTLTDSWIATGGATRTVWGVNVTTGMTINGSAESNGNLVFFGGLGNDTLTGGAGADTIFGGGGGDALRGNGGADVFRYDNPGDSIGATDVTRDRILDFNPGDRIDLSRIDAIAGGTDDSFSFIGSAAFGGGGASAGQLRYTDAGGGNFIVEGDVNGDGIADFALSVTMAPATPPVATDFVL